MKKILLSLFFLLTFSLSADQIVIRAAIDIGMGGPKLQVAKVDMTSDKIVEVLYTEKYFVNFYDSISQENDKKISLDTMEKGLQAIKNAIKKAEHFGVEGIVAVATASFRNALNGNEFAATIEKETGVKVHIIDQDLEAKLAYQAALAKTDIFKENLVVWDIGGGSMQFICQSDDGDHIIDCGKKGVGAFNDYLIEQIQLRDPKEYNSPNPISANDAILAIEYAENLSQHINPLMKDKINNPSTLIVGAGNVFGFGVASIIGKSTFTLEDVAKASNTIIDKTDADFGGEFAFCEGSNILLTYGFMRGLNIRHMQVLHITNADGALLYKPFWK